MAQTTARGSRPAALMHTTRHDLPSDARSDLCELLNARLADALDLQSQTKQAHWNVKGMNFWQLHELFDKLAERIEHHGDLLAERATALGGTALGTVRMAANATGLEEFPLTLQDDRAFVEALADRFALHGANLRHAIERANQLGDTDTMDIFTQISREIDESLYFLESHLQGRP